MEIIYFTETVRRIMRRVFERATLFFHLVTQIDYYRSAGISPIATTKFPSSLCRKSRRPLSSASARGSAVFRNSSSRAITLRVSCCCDLRKLFPDVLSTFVPSRVLIERDSTRLRLWTRLILNSRSERHTTLYTKLKSMPRARAILSEPYSRRY